MTRRRAIVDVLLLASIVAIAAFLRFDRLGAPSYWLDEILHQQLTAKFAAQPWWRWIATVHEEHGSLYYLTQVATWLFGTGEAAGRSAAALFGVATIPLVWLASRETRPAAILLAVSPLHVYFSREARGYALLMFLTAALIVLLLRGRSLIAVCVVLAAVLSTAAVAAPVVASAMVVAFVCALVARERWYWRAGFACAATLVLFRLIYAAKPVEDPGWPGFPGLHADFFLQLARMFTVSALAEDRKGWIAVVVILLAVVGAIAIARRSRTQAIVLIGMTILPLGAAITSLKVFDHFFAGRYITPALIGFVLLTGAGISAIARHEIAAALVAIALVTQMWAAARTEPLQKLDWRTIAASIWKNAKPGELVIAAEPWSEVSLRWYLELLPPRRLKLVHIFAPDVADVQRQIRPGVWLVTAGFTSNPGTRQWMCRYPLLLASPLENFRLHYASRAIDGNRTFFFTEGWADPEGSFIWATAKHATITIPRFSTHDATISFRVLPMSHPAVPRQLMRVSLNGHVLGGVTLPDGWSERKFEAPGRYWINGANTLEFFFDFAIAPAALDPKNTDHRTLAASFENLRLAGPATRITALLEKRGEETRFTHLTRERVTPLIERLGFDPNIVWPRLARGELRLDDLAETLAWDEDCGGDLRTVFLALLDREPTPHELRELGALPRERAIGRILKWDEFRAKAAP